MSKLFTRVTNLGVSRRLSYIPPGGKYVNHNAYVDVDGHIDTILKLTNPNQLQEMLRDEQHGLISISYNYGGRTVDNVTIPGVGGGSTVTPVALNQDSGDGSVRPNTADGLLRTINLSRDGTLYPPSNPESGMRWFGWFKAAGGSSRTLTIDSSIIPPSLSSFTAGGTITITDGKTNIIGLLYMVDKWVFITTEGDF